MESFFCYFENEIEKNEADTLYTQLLGMVDEKAKTVKVFGKEFKEPRLTGLYSKLENHTYTYSNNKVKAKKWNDTLEKLARIATEKTGQEYDTALINFYRNGLDSCGTHRDEDAMKGSIASFSFGATRDFHIRDGQTKAILNTIPLQSGSLFVMKQGFQQKYLHELPKRTKISAGRINVTFRNQSKNL